MLHILFQIFEETATTHKNWKLISPLMSIKSAQMGLVVKHCYLELLIPVRVSWSLSWRSNLDIYVWNYSKKKRQKPTDVHGWPVSTLHLHSSHCFGDPTLSLSKKLECCTGENGGTLCVSVCLSVRAYKVSFLWADERKCHGLCAKQKPYWQNGKKKAKRIKLW